MIDRAKSEKLKTESLKQKAESQKLEKRASFTLVEVLLAVSIFVILITIGIASFATATALKKRDTLANDLQSAGRQAMEVMSLAVQGADLNLASGTGFGFRMSNGTNSFPNGPVVDATQLEVYSKSAANKRKFYVESNVLKAEFGPNSASLTPSNIKITNVDLFDGYQKTTTSVDSNTYEQPYVQITLDLETVQLDRETGEPKKATFQTMVKPQSFDNLGLAEVQSGYDLNSGDGASFATGKKFSKKPVVIIARENMNEDDQDTYIRDTFTDRFTYSSSVPQQFGHWWLAINGDYPNMIQSGQVRGSDYEDDCAGNPTNAACINYYHKFPNGTDIVSFLMRENASDDNPMITVRENSNTRLAVSGYDWRSTFNWVSINSIINDLVPSSSTNSILKIGNSLTKEGVTLSCKQCQCEERSGSRFHPVIETVDLDLYSCAFYYKPTSYFTNPIIFQVPFDQAFSFAKNPNVLITVKNNRNGYGDYDNAFASQLNMPGVKNVSLSSFTYANLGNIGGLTNQTGEFECYDKSTSCGQIGSRRYPTEGFFTSEGKAALEANYSVNWVAASENFKLTWEYE